VFGQEGVTCDVYDSESDSWVINTTAPVYGKLWLVMQQPSICGR
jgi:hypothetical protein